MDDIDRDPAERGWFRVFYRDWRPTRFGRIVNRFAGWTASTRFGPAWYQRLEVVGRASGKTRSTPVVIPTIDDERYLVSMLGNRAEWVRNVEAADGEAVLRHGRPVRVHLVPVPVDERAPILREYVRIATDGRRHFPLEPGAPLVDYAAITDRYPVFHVEPG